MKCLFSLFSPFASSIDIVQQGGIGAVSIDPKPVRAGEEVRITVSADGGSRR